MVAGLEEGAPGVACSVSFPPSSIVASSSRALGPRGEGQGRSHRRRLPAVAGGALEVGLLRPGRGREDRAGVQGGAAALRGKVEKEGFFFRSSQLCFYQCFFSSFTNCQCFYLFDQIFRIPEDISSHTSSWWPVFGWFGEGGE